MKPNKSLKEIKITPSTVYINMSSPGYGQIFVDGKPIGIEPHQDEYFLDEYDEDVYIRYGISFDADDDDEKSPRNPASRRRARWRASTERSKAAKSRRCMA